MEKGHILRRPRTGEPVQTIVFESYAVDLDRFEAKDQISEAKPRERYFHELVSPAADDIIAQRQPGLLRAELHERFSSPFYPFAFVLIAVAFIGHARTTRQNRVQAIVVAFVIATGARLAGLAGTNVVALQASAIWVVYAIPAGAAMAAVGLMMSRSRLKPPSRLSLVVSEYGSGLVEAAHRVLPRRARPHGSS
jgi:lipopolysaccharide export system permease protein